MYFGGKTQPNGTIASMQRTFYPKYTTYWGDGTGRDNQILEFNGGLTGVQKRSLGHMGVHFKRYNTNQKSRSPVGSPRKEATTWYY